MPTLAACASYSGIPSIVLDECIWGYVRDTLTGPDHDEDDWLTRAERLADRLAELGILHIPDDLDARLDALFAR